MQNPWALAFLPQGRFLVTERPGRQRVVEPDGRLGPPVAGLPAIAASGQGGLLDVITDAGFAANRRIYFCFSEPAASGGGNSTALARATLAADHSRLEDVQVLFSQKPKFSSSAHFGCSIAEAHRDGKPDGTYWTHEHGPQGGDEINLPQAGRNFYVLTDSPSGRLLRLQPADAGRASIEWALFQTTVSPRVRTI